MKLSWSLFTFSDKRTLLFKGSVFLKHISIPHVALLPSFPLRPDAKENIPVDTGNPRGFWKSWTERLQGSTASKPRQEPNRKIPPKQDTCNLHRRLLSIELRWTKIHLRKSNWRALSGIKRFTRKYMEITSSFKESVRHRFLKLTSTRKWATGKSEQASFLKTYQRTKYFPGYDAFILTGLSFSCSVVNVVDWTIYFTVILERFSNDCRKTKTKVITDQPNRNKQRHETIRIQKSEFRVPVTR